MSDYVCLPEVVWHTVNDICTDTRAHSESLVRVAYNVHRGYGRIIPNAHRLCQSDTTIGDSIRATERLILLRLLQCCPRDRRLACILG